MAETKLIVVLFVAVLCLNFAPPTRATTVAYTFCGATADENLITVQTLDITPYPVVLGEEVIITVRGRSEASVSQGILVIEISYFGLVIHTEEHKLCEETSCLVSIGDFVVSHSEVLPEYAPPGKYQLKMKLVDDGKHELACISFGFRIGRGSFVAES